MNKKKLIICVLVVIAIIAVVVIVLLSNKTIKIFDNSKTKEDYVGKYHTNDYFGVEASITLNDDDTCSFSDNENSCVWEYTEEGITLKITSYKLKQEIKDFHATFKNKEECETAIFLIKEKYKMDELDCEINKTTEYNISLEEDNISLSNYVFTKQ